MKSELAWDGIEREAAQEAGFAKDDGPFGQPGICMRCHDDSPNVDEATELCEMCFEHVFGDAE